MFFLCERNSQQSILSFTSVSWALCLWLFATPEMPSHRISLCNNRNTSKNSVVTYFSSTSFVFRRISTLNVGDAIAASSKKSPEESVISVDIWFFPLKMWGGTQKLPSNSRANKVALCCQLICSVVCLLFVEDICVYLPLSSSFPSKEVNNRTVYYDFSTISVVAAPSLHFPLHCAIGAVEKLYCNTMSYKLTQWILCVHAVSATANRHFYLLIKLMQCSFHSLQFPNEILYFYLRIIVC